MAVAFAVTAAKADFYTLDGRFQCLERPGAVCYDATVSRVPSVLAPSSPAPIEPAVTAKAAAVAPPPPAPFVPAVPAKPPAPSRTSALTQPPRDPILMIAARIKAERPAPDDLAVLRRAALADDSRAIELLAWCTLKGIGTNRDAVAAYFLYGEAAAEEVPHARANQEAIYERSLTSDERQRVLDIAAVPHATRRLRAFLLSDNAIAGAPNDVR